MPKTHEAPATKTAAAPDNGSGETSNDGLPVISSLDLSWLAEKADGSRDEDLALVKDAKGALQIREARAPGTAPVLEPGDVMIAKVRTNGSCKREQVIAVTIETESGKQPAITGKGPDAVFWTESAVEKFLYPYYHSQRIWDTDMDALKAKFSKDKNAFAILHRAPSTSKTLTVHETLEIGRLAGTNVAPKLEWVGLKKYLRESSPGDPPQ